MNKLGYRLRGLSKRKYVGRLKRDKQQEALEKYIFGYNKIRPHESLDMETPYERYVKLSKSRIM